MNNCIFCNSSQNLHQTAFNTYICDDCIISHNYVQCEDCGDYAPEDSTYSTHDGRQICENCRQDHYTTCVNCEELFHDDDIIYHDGNDDYYCNYCYPSNVINEYHCNDAFEFHSTTHDTTYCPDPSQIYLGTEVEIESTDRSVSLEELAEYAVNHLPVQCSEDGSISHGFEMVSHPHTFEAHQQNRNEYKEAYEYLVSQGARGDETSTCGLHVHVSRDPLNEDTPYKIILFMETYKEELCNFARRTSNHYAQFLSDYLSNDNDEEIKALKFIKENKPTTRYMALNLQPSHTIEFRLFKSTLNVETYMATLNFVDNLVKVCNSDTPIDKITWDMVVNYNMTDDLHNYLERRGILTSSKNIIDYTSTYEKKQMLDNIRKAQLRRLFEKEFKKGITKISRHIRKTLDGRFVRGENDMLACYREICGYFDSATYSKMRKLFKDYYISTATNLTDRIMKEVLQNVYNSSEE